MSGLRKRCRWIDNCGQDRKKTAAKMIKGKSEIQKVRSQRNRKSKRILREIKKVSQRYERAARVKILQSRRIERKETIARE